MKTSFAVVLAVVLCGCGGAVEKQMQSERTNNALSSSDPLMGCYNYGTQYTVCISAPGQGSLVFSDNHDPCWRNGDLVWFNIAPDGNGAYLADRHASGNWIGCNTSYDLATIRCTGGSNGTCSTITETSSLVTATWTRQQDYPSFPCSGTYSLPGWSMSMPGGTLTVVPPSDTCWSVNDAAYTFLAWDGGGWMSGIRWNPKNPKPGCPVQQPRSAPGSLVFSSDCSQFTEYNQWATLTWRK